MCQMVFHVPSYSILLVVDDSWWFYIDYWLTTVYIVKMCLWFREMGWIQQPVSNGGNMWQWWQHMTVECADILLFDFQLKAIMRVLDWIYSQSCTRRYDLKSAKRFYEQPVQEPVQGCLWKTVAATCSNNVVSSSCVMLPYLWSSLDVGYWMGCELGEYSRRSSQDVCFGFIVSKCSEGEISGRTFLQVRSDMVDMNQWLPTRITVWPRMLQEKKWCDGFEMFWGELWNPGPRQSPPSPPGPP